MATALLTRPSVSSNVARFAATLEKVCIDTVESGRMTKDLALLVGGDARYLSTEEFLDALDEGLQTAMR